MKTFIASVLFFISIHQQSFAVDQCPDFSGTYQSGNGEGWASISRLKQNACDSLDVFLSESDEYKILQLKMEGRPLYDNQLDKITTAEWVNNILSYIEYEDVSEFGYLRYTEASLSIEGNALKWSYRQFRDGKIVDQGTLYAKKIK